MKNKLLPALEYAKGTGFLVLVAPFFIVFGAGFLFGPDVAYYFPGWLGWWFFLAFGLLACIAGYQKILSILKVPNRQNHKYAEMPLTKSPDLDYEGMAERWKHKDAERNKLTSKK